MQTRAKEMEENLVRLHESVDNEKDDESSVEKDSLLGEGDDTKR